MSLDELRVILRTARELGITEDGFAPTHDVKAALDFARSAGFVLPDGASSSQLVGLAVGWLQDNGYCVEWDRRPAYCNDYRDYPEVRASRPSASIDHHVSMSARCGPGDDGRAAAILKIIGRLKNDGH